MAKDLVAVYEEILREAQEALGLPDPQATRSRLYALLLRTPLDPGLQRVLNEHGVSASYTRTHLLSIGSWPERVQEAMRMGLPYQDARRVAQLGLQAQGDVLDAFFDQAIESPHAGAAAARLRERELAHAAAAASLRLASGGWVRPSAAPAREPRGVRSTEVFRGTELQGGRDALPARLIEGLLASYTSRGGAVLDLMAGYGNVAIVGSAVGRRVWSGDLAPRYGFVHRVDATDAASLRGALGDPVPSADLVLLHPPTFEDWRSSGDQRTVDEYEGWISTLVRVATPFVGARGYLVVIVRPHRERSAAWPHVGAIDAAMRTVGRLVGYHVAVEAHGGGDWHVLVSAG